MFCCRGPPCLDEAEPSRKEKRKQEKLLPDDKKSHATLHDSIYIHQPNTMHARPVERPDSTRIQNMLHANQRFMDPRVKHVTDVHNDMHVKLAGFQQRVTGYVEGSYRIVKVPVYTRKPSDPQHAKTHREFARTSTPAWTVIGKNEINFAQENDSDTESFSTKQMAAIAQLDYAIDKYKTDSDDESVSPTIVADVLPPGVYESFDAEKELRPSDSDQPPSRSSSVSDKSGSSRSGIISNRMSTGSEKRKNNSVSFQLPEAHVDKPYAPMQTSRKQKPTTHAQLEMTANVSPPSTLIIKTGNVKLAHAGNGIILENQKNRRLSFGPFKGSFKDLFYGKFANSKEMPGEFKKGGKYVTPGIMEKVESFENIHDPFVFVNQGQARPQSANGLSRRHTFR